MLASNIGLAVALNIFYVLGRKYGWTVHLSDILSLIFG